MGENVYDRRVKDFVTQDLVTLRVGDTVHAALKLMGENRVSTLPVVDANNCCVGILSTADLVDMTRDTEEDLRELELIDLSSKKFLVDKLAQNLGNEKVQAYMSAPSFTVRMETSIGKAAKKMLRNHVHHLPVLDVDDQLVGIISTLDILCEFADAAPD